ncbi:MAG TPA: DUF481 domain-containing protein [Thermoanaerobaculia bacterium]|nr:DUF481 domain-containing protein [Thermoanaerobaculia bacterium]
MKASTLFLLALLACSLALAQDAPPAPPPPAWTSSLGAGLALTDGNSDTSSINLAFGTVWDPKTDRTFKADAVYLRGEADGETNSDKTAANGRYERSYDRRFWFGELSYLRDALKGMDYLISPIAGVGYHLVRTDTRTLSVDAGVGAAFESTEGIGSDSSGAIKAGEAFDWAISPVSRFTQRLNGLWKADDFDDSFYHFDAGIATTIAARAELKVSYIYDYKNLPPPGLEKGDSALFAALLYKF